MITVRMRTDKNAKKVFEGIAQDIANELILATDRALKRAERISKSEYLSGPRPSRLQSGGGLKSRVGTESAKLINGKVIGNIGVNYRTSKGVDIAKLWEKTGHRAFITPKTGNMPPGKAIIIPVASLVGMKKGKMKYRRVPVHKAEIGIGGLLERGASAWIFRKHAHIPAVKPRPFLSPAIDRVVPDWLRSIGAIFKKWGK